MSRLLRSLFLKDFKLLLAWLFIIPMLVGCDTTNKDWETAKNTSTIVGLEGFLKNHPNSQYDLEARTLLEKLEWENISKEKSASKVSAFLKKYRDGHFYNEAQSLLETLEWDNAKKLNSIDGYKEFLTKYPDSSHLEKGGIIVPFSLNWFNPADSSNKIKGTVSIKIKDLEESGPTATKENSDHKFAWMPADGYKVSGKVITSLGGLSKTANFGGWDYIYADSNKSAISSLVSSAECLTSGQLILPVDKFTEATSPNMYLFNDYSVKLLSDKYVLVTLEPKRKENLCMVSFGFNMEVASTYYGSSVHTEKGTFTKTEKGWLFKQ